MTTNEVAQAAERRRANASPHYIYSGQSMEDADVLADAYLALVHADSEEPITEEWLRSEGFVRRCGRNLQLLVMGQTWIGLSENHEAYNSWCVEVYRLTESGRILDTVLLLSECKTRGQLRNLAAALRIQLKEGAK